MVNFVIQIMISEARTVAPFKDIDLAEKNFIETPYFDPLVFTGRHDYFSWGEDIEGYDPLFVLVPYIVCIFISD